MGQPCQLLSGQIGVDDKSNEIPAVQESLEILNLKGAVVTADAIHCHAQPEEDGKKDH